ncbi:MAG: hypothetical protein ACLT98_09805 [Eggerthellaceae bacterium]
MLVSCDNAHAVHPNHPEKYDYTTGRDQRRHRGEGSGQSALLHRRVQPCGVSGVVRRRGRSCADVCELRDTAGGSTSATCRTFRRVCMPSTGRCSWPCIRRSKRWACATCCTHPCARGVLCRRCASTVPTCLRRIGARVRCAPSFSAFSP